MEIAIGSSVYGKQGHKVGEVSYIVLDGQTGELTHLVVSKGWLLPRDIVVAVADVEAVRDGEVRLRLDEAQLERQPDFIEEHYVTPDAGDPLADRYATSYATGSLLFTPTLAPFGAGWYGPRAYAGVPTNVETERNVPEGSITLSEGMDVWAGTEKVGSIAGVRVHPRTGRLSHILVSKGVLLPEELLVSQNAIASVDAAGVHLTTSPDDLRRLAGLTR
jgi:uncharacterized protein YrrD